MRETEPCPAGTEHHPVLSTRTETARRPLTRSRPPDLRSANTAEVAGARPAIKVEPLPARLRSRPRSPDLLREDPS